MKKIILISAVTLFSTGVYADDSHQVKGCDEGSLKGKYGFEVSGVNSFPIPTPTGLTPVTRSTHMVGQAYFDGQKKFDIVGYGSTAGFTAERTGTGTYFVNKDNCTAEGTMTWNTGDTSNFLIVLDNMEDSSDDHSDGKEHHSSDDKGHHSAKKAHHASMIVDSKTASGLYPSSASGSLTRFNGKFN